MAREWRFPRYIVQNGSRRPTDYCTQENGVFVFQLAPLPETQGHAFPTKAIYMAERFLSPVEVTCLQLTRTSLWQVFYSTFPSDVVMTPCLSGII